MSVPTVFRPRPGDIEAMQFDGTAESLLALSAWVNPQGDPDADPLLSYHRVGPDGANFDVELHTRFATVGVEPSDWVVHLGPTLGFVRFTAAELDGLYEPAADDPGILTDAETRALGLIGEAAAILLNEVPENTADLVEDGVYGLRTSILAGAAERLIDQDRFAPLAPLHVLEGGRTDDGSDAA